MIYCSFVPCKTISNFFVMHREAELKPKISVQPILSFKETMTSGYMSFIQVVSASSLSNHAKNNQWTYLSIFIFPFPVQ